MSIQGRRLPDTEEGSFPTVYEALMPGDYWRLLDKDTGLPIVVDDRQYLAS